MAGSRLGQVSSWPHTVFGSSPLPHEQGIVSGSLPLPYTQDSGSIPHQHRQDIPGCYIWHPALVTSKTSCINLEENRITGCQRPGFVLLSLPLIPFLLPCESTIPVHLDEGFTKLQTYSGYVSDDGHDGLFCPPTIFIYFHFVITLLIIASHHS